MSQDRQIEIASWFGPIRSAPENVGYLSNDASKHPGNATGLAFHSDFSWTPHPINALSLHAIDVADNASTTRFSNTMLAYENMSAATRSRLDHAEIDMAGPLIEDTEKPVREWDPTRLISQTRGPAVKTCDRTGRRYFNVSDLCTLRIANMSAAESDALLQEVFEQLYWCGNVHKHVWRNGDFLIWNNRTIRHARSNMAHVGRRILQRVAAGLSLHELDPAQTATYNMDQVDTTLEKALIDVVAP